MRHRVLDASVPGELSAWLALWERWPGREVFAHPEYVRLFARPGDRAVCAVGEDAGGVILFPLVVRPLAAEPWAPPGEPRSDAVSPYGYGGPFAFGEGARDDLGFWRAHEGWCREAGVVSTFARLSLFDQQLPRIPVPVESRGPNVVRALGPDLSAIWMEYDRQVRANVKAAERSGVEIEVDRTGARLDAFVEVYEHTMRRRGASGWYFFPRSFFDDLVRGLAGQFVFFHALHAGQVVSSELILLSREHAYMLLSGTRAEAYPLRPNDLLRHRTVAWAAEQGLRAYVLGGGYEPGDGVFRHKRNFAPKGQLPFRVACLVHDEAAARELEARRAAGAVGWTPKQGYFPRYRG
ncbi:MAG TPA: GNAT family N-acetyltransferase [Anaeromyxobacter sp.]